MVVTLGALDVYVTTGHGKQRFYGMRIMTISAPRFIAMQAFIILIKNGNVTILASRSGWPESVCGMPFAYLLVTGRAPNPRMCRQGVLCRIKVEVSPFIHDILFAMTFQAIAFHGKCGNRNHHAQERRWNQKQKAPGLSLQYSFLLLFNS
jgi:hypothetical protein